MNAQKVADETLTAQEMADREVELRMNDLLQKEGSVAEVSWREFANKLGITIDDVNEDSVINIPQSDNRIAMSDKMFADAFCQFIVHGRVAFDKAKGTIVPTV